VDYRRKDSELNVIMRMLSEFIPFCLVRLESLEWNQNGEKVDLPFRWMPMNIPTVFETEVCLSTTNPIEAPYLRAWFGGESLIKVDDRDFGEINEYHREISLAEISDGKVHKITVETMPRGLFGTKSEPIFSEGSIVWYDVDMRRAINFFRNVAESIRETKNEALSKALINLLFKFLPKVDLPKSTDIYIKSLAENIAEKGVVGTVWEPVDVSQSHALWTYEIRELLLNSYNNFRNEMKNLSMRFPKIEAVYLAGHAHIDYAWLWPVEETKRKIVRTFTNAVQLAKKYPEFIYIQSSAQMYEDLKEISPELYEEIKDLVKKGQWEPVGGMWVESDCNVPSVESLIRQFYYGQKLFEEEFGKISKVAWLPDVFGFSWILPQILKGSGIDFFVTTKLNWNESNEFPYDICRWRGIDGTEVVYYNYKNMEEGYNGRISAKSILNTWENFRQKELTNKVFLTFGYGDGGGGPTEEMCENYYALREIPGIPNIEYSTTERFFENLLTDFSKEDLPIWDGELYLELHRGTLTSQSRTKRLHKVAEDELRTTEILNALYSTDYQSSIDSLWKILLRNEFHDILPGSSIHEVYEKTNEELEFVIRQCKEIQTRIISAASENLDNYLTIFNPSSYERNIEFEYDKDVEIRFNDIVLNKARTYSGTYLYSANIALKPLQVEILKVERNVCDENNSEDLVDKEFFIHKMDNGYIVESKFLKVDVFSDGSIQIYNKLLQKYAFKDNGNLIALYKDIPAYWDNWDIDYRSKLSEKLISAESISIVEDNFLRKVLKVVYRIENSIIEQWYIIENNSEEVKVRTKIDWHLRRSVLKVKFPTNVLARYAKFDIDDGYIERATHRNTNFEKARFEVLAHRWVDISQYDFGVTIINDGKYGHSVEESTIDMTLVKAGIYPDFYDDEGIQELSYSIYLHGKCDMIDIIKRADRFNRECVVFEGYAAAQQMINIMPSNFKVLSYRKLGSKKILRICEQVGASGIVNINTNFDFEKAYITNLLEKEHIEVQNIDGSMSFEYTPFKIYTVVFE